MHRSSAVAAQLALSCLGFQPGRIDGDWGRKSRAAWDAWVAQERAHGSEGVLLVRLQERLLSARQACEERALTLPQLQAILAGRSQGASAARLAELYPHLRAALVEGCLSVSPQRQASFLAQLFHESGGLRYMEEIASGQGYEGRKDLGNTQPGDGRRYKGRGPIQLTGRANYRRFGELLGLDLEGHPELAGQPDVGFRVAVAYWTDRNLNAAADAAARDPEAAFLTITRAINGGTNGLDDRRAWLAACWRILA